MSVIGVFCASRIPADARHVATAEALGRWIGENGHTLLYGGSRLGLMEVTAQAARKAGARIYGAIPDALVARGLVSECVDVEFRCAGLSDRKEIFVREGDLFVALPGGVGTLDEVFTVVAGATLGEHAKRVVLLGEADFWEPLRRVLESMQRQGLVDEHLNTRLAWVTEVNQLKNFLPDPCT